MNSAPEPVLLALPVITSYSIHYTKLYEYEQNTRMQGHRYSPDMSMLFFSERTGQNVAEFAVKLV